MTRCIWMVPEKNAQITLEEAPTPFCVCKPDIVAPGSNIHSCNARFGRGRMSYYISKAELSMSTPIVSGAIALLLSKYKHMTNVEVKLRLRECSDDMGLPHSQQGWGRLNIKKLLG